MEDFYDESGELGNSKKSSRHFIMAGVTIPNPKEFERNFKKFVKKIHKKKNLDLLHANSDSDLIKNKMVKFLKSQDWSGKVFVVDKQLNRNKDITYENILEKIHNKTAINIDKINIATFYNNKSYVNRILNKFPKIYFVTPTNCKLIQVADFISWTSFRNFESGDDFYFSLLQNKLEIIHL